MTFAAVGMAALVALLVGVYSGQWLAGGSAEPSSTAANDDLLQTAPADGDRALAAGRAHSAVDLGLGPLESGLEPHRSALVASLDRGRFELAGVVPSIEVATEIRSTVVTIYGTEIVDRLAVDPAVAEAPWLLVAADVVASLPIISSGRIVLTTDSATLQGVAGSPAKRDLFVGSVAELLGTEFELNDEVTVVEQLPPQLVIRKSGAHTIEVSGVVPSTELRDQIEQSINGSYAGYNVVTDLAIDAAVEDTFTLHSLPEFAELFFGFPAWELRYVDENLESSSSGSAAFDVGSAAVPPLGKEILDNVAARLAGMPSLRLAVDGHTDAVGDDEQNQILSEQRAQAVVDYLVDAHGIDPARLTAQGFGETQPLESNDTDAGRERNRRVDFRFVLTAQSAPGPDHGVSDRPGSARSGVTASLPVVECDRHPPFGQPPRLVWQRAVPQRHEPDQRHPLAW